jgi:protease I
MKDITGKKILILATNGFEQSELEVPRDRLSKGGAKVEITAPASGEIKGWDKTDWGRPVKVDRTLADVSAKDYDAIVLPGGQMNPDTLRGNNQALDLIRAFYDSGKVVAAVCHAPWLLINTGIANGRMMTSWPTVRTDLRNAGGTVVDEPVVSDNGVVTSRKPDDLEAFSDKIAEELLEGRHARQAA